MIDNYIRLKDVYNIIDNKKTRGAWNNGVKVYALYLLEGVIIEEDDPVYTVPGLKDRLLNGAKNWQHYAAGGGGFVYDYEIASTLCTPAQLKRYTYKEGGLKDPNKYETWIDVEARALLQAWQLIRDTITAKEV
ncbi:MAG: hypothetical protein VZR95_09430 [Alphaproteobacteria bacterium]